MNLISDTLVKAKKHHPCDACHWFNFSSFGQADVTPDDWLIIQAAQSDKWKIKPGEIYRRIVCVDGGQIQTFKARLDMDGICAKYELYPDD